MVDDKNPKKPSNPNEEAIEFAESYDPDIKYSIGRARRILPSERRSATGERPESALPLRTKPIETGENKEDK